MGTLELKDPEYGTKAVGNKLAGLVKKTNSIELHALTADHVDYDVAVMFTYQAKEGVLQKLGAASKSGRLYLNSYWAKRKAFSDLYDKFKTEGNGIKFNFVFFDQKDYTKYTGNTAASTSSNNLLYFVATPIDHNDKPLKEHFLIFNLNHSFDIGKDVMEDSIFENFINNYQTNLIYADMSNYCSPKEATREVYYTWEDIKGIIDEENSMKQHYEELKFMLGEIIEFDIILEHFKDNPDYKFDRDKYDKAYAPHEKKLTILGKFQPEDPNGKEGYFDMGSLYP